ncbi:leucyl aminopeptidase family protein [Citreimonas salinaria]|uniref:Leucyl aminopeptidase n=1 Tax=Citreimonas salinaria TaxID=321339 RepID=A0A1H3FIM8_9RHOB|nr:leucyl aminopeptidase family protein [Citreimonas salinaria]SDX90983.1 leucyl aminopeptidase [Citreimonas salinaria]
MSLSFAPATSEAWPLHVLSPDKVDAWLAQADDTTRRWVQASGFDGAIGAALMIPGPEGAPCAALVGHGTPGERARLRFPLAAAVPRLAPGIYRIAGGGIDHAALANECLGWLLSCYTFTRYRRGATDAPGAELVAPDGIDSARIEILAEAEAMTRDLINIPPADMGPAALENAARAVQETFDASISVIAGDALIEQNFPMIHAVGRAGPQAPRLIDMRWGETGPLVTLVGKGVCFDTGGLNLKPGSSMGLMKKDMGGAANVLGLAQAIMALELPVRLRVLIPAVENSVSSNSFRPQDILTSRKGMTVEVNNTDAEGRLVLADALALACEEKPDLLISMATLTGAARVAVGPDIAPFFTDDDPLAAALEQAARAAADPVWRLPFHTPYEAMIEPGIADLDNAPSGGMAGAITAALFLRRFVEPGTRYAHLDIYGWQPVAAPGRSKGGLGQGSRAILGALESVLEL